MTCTARLVAFCACVLLALQLVAPPTQCVAASATGACCVLFPHIVSTGAGTLETDEILCITSSGGETLCLTNGGAYGGDGSSCSVTSPRACNCCPDSHRILFSNDGLTRLCVDPPTLADAGTGGTVSLADLALAGFGHMPACRRSTGTCRFQAVTGNEATFLAGVLSAPNLDEVDYCANCEVSATPAPTPAACPDCACARQACCDPQTAACSDDKPPDPRIVAGKKGKAISLISSSEIRSLWDIENRCRTSIQQAEL